MIAARDQDPGLARSSARGRMGRLAVVGLAITATLVTSSPSSPAEATSIVPFGIAFSTNDNGSIAVFGNNLMVCPPAAGDCAATRAGTTTKNNNNYNMVHLDVDGTAFPTFSSSSADTVLPDGAVVRWAGLYWGARLGRGTGGLPASGDGRQMKLRAPGDPAYRTITAGRLFGPSTTPDRAYQAFANVTDIVRAAGPGTYVGADVPAATGEDRHAGWSLVVVYNAPGLPLRNLTVFDGLADVGQNDPQSITISGFTTPVTGTVNSRIGLVAYEGDRGSTGDRAIFNGTQLATTLSPGTNFFNGTADDNGTIVTSRGPADVNMLGFDIKNFDAPGILGNSATSARIDLASTSERYFPGVVTTAIDVFAPDFSPSIKTVTDVSGNDPARVGDTLRYTVTFVNGGQDPAVDTSIVDPLPAGTTYVPGSFTSSDGLVGGYDAGVNAVVVPSSGTFAVGAAKTFTFDVILGPDAAGSQVSNRATITYDGATVAALQDLQFSTAATSTPVVPSADLEITKENTPDPVVAGGALTSIITVGNDGPNAATDVVVTDELPAGLGTVTATPSQGACSVTGQLVECRVGVMAPGAVVTVSVVAAVPPDAAAASLADIARVASATADPDAGDNTVGATADVTRDADLSVTKSVSPLTVSPGEPLTYTVTATNNGPSTATAVVLDDAVPDPRIEPQEAFVALDGVPVPTAPCSADPRGARCTIPSLAPGAVATMTVDALARSDATPGVVPNTATASAATPDSDPSDDATTEEVTIGPAVSVLDVAKSVDAPTPLIAGIGEVRYTIEVVNDGPSDADPVTATDVLPAGFVALSATSDRGSCTIAPAPTGDTVTCAIGGLLAPFGTNPGASAEVTIVAEVPAGVAPGDYPNVATASAPSAGTTTSPPAPVSVTGLADVAITKSFPQGSDPDITPGTTETYRLRVVNDGPSAAVGVVVTDALPPELTATAWRVGSVTPPGPAPACDVATATCELGDLPPGTTVELELDVLVDGGLIIDPDVGIANSATVVSATDDPNEANNASTFVASGGAQADLSVRKIPPAESPVAGDSSDASLADRSYVIEIANFGPSAAPGVTFTDTLPPGVTFERIYDAANPTFDLTPLLNCTVTGTSVTGQTVSCSPPSFDLPAFVGVFFSLEFTVDATVADGTVLNNSIEAASDADDANPGNNASTALVAVRAVVNLQIEKRVYQNDAAGNFVPPVPPGEEPVRWPEGQDPLGVAPGLPVSFAVIVTNLGPSAAADVQLIDAFPPDAITLPVAGECQFLDGETICENPGLLLPDASFGTQIISIPLGDTPPGIFTNTALASTSTEETTLVDNVATRPIEIVDPVADLVIDKAAVTSPLVAGESFTFQIEVSAGLIDFTPPGALRLSSDAEDVVVTDTLPAGLVPSSVTSSQGACTVVAQTVRCELGTLESARSVAQTVPALITVTGRVAPGITGDSVPNTAVATSSTPLLGGGTSVSSTATTPVTRAADLTVTKVADSDTAFAGGGASFTITVTNAGPSDATGAVLTDVLPAPFVFDATGSDDECSLVGTDVVCALGTVSTDAPRILTIAATLPPGAPVGPITNTATVTSAVDDPDAANDEASTDVEVARAADLTVTKVAAAEGVLLGDTIAYSLSVRNEGPSDTTGVVLTESIPPGTTVVTLPPGCTGSGPVECAIADLVAGDAVVLDLVLDVPDTLTPGVLDNVASVSSDLDDPDLADNTASARVEAVAQADVTLDKVLVTADPIAGQPVTYELRLTNNGPTVAPNASLSDPIPLGSTFVSITATQGTCQLDEVDLDAVPAASCALGRMEVGATVTATIVVTTDPAATTVTNTGSGGSGGLDEVPADNEDTVTTPLRAVADLSATKTGPAEVAAGGTGEYVIAYANAGPSVARAVVVSDTVDAGLVPTAPSGCTVTDRRVDCPVGDVPPGGSGTVVVPVAVDGALAIGAVVGDTAVVSSDAVDPEPADNSAAFASTVARVTSTPPPDVLDVGVDVVAVQDEVAPGATVTFDVLVTNNGTLPAPAVVLTVQRPLEVEPGALPAVCVGGALAGAATCALGDLAPGQVVTVTFTGSLARSTRAGVVLRHSATVVVAGDAVALNNADVDTIVVVAVVVVVPARPGVAPRPGGRLPATGPQSLTGLMSMGVLAAVVGTVLQLVDRPLMRRRRRPAHGR